MSEALKSHQIEQQENVRDIDPNVQQRKASNPEANVWVGASAGSGKTKVLTDRILRLLLPRKNGTPGTNAFKILALTFTKAAAKEMAIRLNKKLSKWAVQNETDLEEDLRNLLGYEVTQIQIKTARKLFAHVIDTPGGIQIMTIHAFCQSILSRFPLEANLAPYFSLIDEQDAQKLLLKAQNEVISQKHEDEDIKNALNMLSKNFNEDQFSNIIKALLSERRQLKSILNAYFNAQGLYTGLCKEFGIQPGESRASILQKFICGDKSSIKAAAEQLQRSKSKTDLEKSYTILQWLTLDDDEKIIKYNDYKHVFLKKSDNQIAKTLITKSFAESYPHILSQFEEEAQNIFNLEEIRKSIANAEFTRDVFIIGEAILNKYEHFKEEKAVVDFDDLILKTSELLDIDNITKSQWVSYKLNQAINHILVDEAQDTNPDQWKIIEGLCNEFFSGKGIDTEDRTIFVVGDEKQSIYSFQRASPEAFKNMREMFARKVTEAQKKWSPVNLNVSFRSSESVLKAVDAVFKNLYLGQDQLTPEITHKPYRIGQEGIVELWPLFENDLEEEDDPWEPPTHIVELETGQKKCADHIAGKIENWIKNKEILPSTGLPIKPGDIMILLKSRSTLATQIIRSLKNKNIPVSGHDRMVLGNEIIIEDLMAAANFALLPSDDLTLACFLKSPIINLSETQLYEYAIDREGSLWESVQKRADKNLIDYLKTIIKTGQERSPFDFFNKILHTPCPASDISALAFIKARLGEDMLDTIQEFISLVLQYEQTQTGSLQNFCHWQKEQNIEIKRELENAEDQVRVMTIHGSKGLQSPIVIMPDTVHIKSSGQHMDNKILWPEKTNLKFPLCSPNSSYETEIFVQAKGILKERAEEEYRRLLYVAMTRAENRLYICGFTKKKKPSEDSWYFYVKNALQELSETEEIEDGTLRLYNPQTKDPDRLRKDDEDKDDCKFIPPEWIYKQAPKQIKVHKTSASPSSKSLVEILDQTHDNKAAERGEIIHKLLEILPQKPKSQWSDLAHKITKTDTANLLQETVQILEHPEYQKFFGPHSRAEVDISYKDEQGNIVMGRIDRLLIEENDIWIIDFKSGQPADSQEKIPLPYKIQLERYAIALKAIYPKHAIHKALLWTETAQMMRVT